MGTLRLSYRAQGSEHVVELTLEGAGARQTAAAKFRFGLTAQDREDMRWYLEEYLQYPVDPAPLIAGRVEESAGRDWGSSYSPPYLRRTGTRCGCGTRWRESLADTRVEVVAGVEGAAAVPWELLRDPATDGVLALRAAGFVRTQAQAARSACQPGRRGRCGFYWSSAVQEDGRMCRSVRWPAIWCALAGGHGRRSSWMCCGRQRSRS